MLALGSRRSPTAAPPNTVGQPDICASAELGVTTGTRTLLAESSKMRERFLQGGTVRSGIFAWGPPVHGVIQRRRRVLHQRSIYITGRSATPPGGLPQAEAFCLALPGCRVACRMQASISAHSARAWPPPGIQTAPHRRRRARPGRPTGHLQQREHCETWGPGSPQSRVRTRGIYTKYPMLRGQ